MPSIQKNHLFTLSPLQEITFRRHASRGDGIDSAHFQLRRVHGKDVVTVFTDTNTGHRAKLVEKGGTEKELASQQDSPLQSGSRIVFQFTDGEKVNISFRWACLAKDEEKELPGHSYCLVNVKAPDDFELKTACHGNRVYRTFAKI